MICQTFKLDGRCKTYLYVYRLNRNKNGYSWRPIDKYKPKINAHMICKTDDKFNN